MTLQQRRDLTFLVLAGIFLGTMGMLNILGLTRFLQLGTIGSWPIVVAVPMAIGSTPVTAGSRVPPCPTRRRP